MEIRHIVPEEYERTRNIQTIAFGGRNDPAAKPRPGAHRSYRAAFEGGRARACLESFPLRATLNGAQVGMSGIGGVATLPEARRRGYIRELFRYTLAESRENGDAFSYLFPFSHVFYRRFGYESCMVKAHVRVPLAALPAAAEGFATLYEPGGGASDIRALYEDFAGRFNLMTRRSDEKWERLLGCNPYTERRYLYVWHAADGTPLGYVRFAARDDAAGGEKDAAADELVWASGAGLRGMLGFLGGFTAQYRNLLLRAPASLNLRLLLAEPYALESRTACAGMGRVVDAARALATLAAPEKGGAVVLRVHDDFLDWNDGTFAVYSQGGKAVAEPTARPPEIETDVRTLAQLVTGYASAEDCRLAGTARFTGDFARAARLFPARPTFIADEF